MDATDQAMTTLGSLVTDKDDQCWAELAVEWQFDDAQAILDTTGPRKHFVTRPRSGSKTTDLAGIAIAVMVDQAPAAARCYVVAADQKQAGFLHDAMAGFIERTPGLAGVLHVGAEKITNRRNGATLEVLTADGASVWGLRPYLVIADEIGQWPETRNARRVWQGLISAWPKVPNGRLVAMTSAGEPSHFSFGIRETALKSNQWRVSEMPGPVPWLDPAEIEEQRAELAATPSAFDRLHLNIWTESEDRLTTRDEVMDCVTHSGRLVAQPGVRYVIGVDLGLVDDAAVITVAHSETRLMTDEENPDDAAHFGYTHSQHVVVDHVVRFKGSKRHPVHLPEVEQTIRTLASAYDKKRTKIVLDVFQARGMAQHLADDRYRAVDVAFTPELHNRIATTLLGLLRDRALELPDDPDLIEELSTVRLLKNKNGIGVRIDHDSGRHDDHVMSLGLAAIELVDITNRKTKPHSMARSVQQHAPTKEQVLRQAQQRMADKGDAVAKRDLANRRSTMKRYSLATALRGRR